MELESGLCESRKEDKTDGLSTPRDEAIADSSPQAESIEKVDSSAKSLAVGFTKETAASPCFG